MVQRSAGTIAMPIIKQFAKRGKRKDNDLINSNYINNLIISNEKKSMDC